MSSALPNYDEAAALVAGYAADLRRFRLPVEHVELTNAAGRVLAEALVADRDQPAFSRSTRDGYACRAEEASTHAPLRIVGSIRAGDAPGGPLPEHAAWEIMTGAPVPEGADAVMMLEHVKEADGAVRLLPPRMLAEGENVVARGAQARAGDELLAPGAAIGFGQIALAATCGYGALDVYERPRVAILSTGDELVPPESDPAPGQIRNSNSPMLAQMVAAAGGEPWVFPVVADNEAALDAALAEAAKAHLLLISGGVSAGKFDLVEPALVRAGASFRFTGARIQPGKPVVFGELPRCRGGGSSAPVLPFFGLPGNPVSSAVTFVLFAAPVLAALAGRQQLGPNFALAHLTGEVKGKPGLMRFLPAWCNFGGQFPEVALVPWQGSGDLTALARSNCFLVLPEETDGLETGALVRILLA